MASQEEDKLECISNVNKEQEIYYLNIYKIGEFIYDNESDLRSPDVGCGHWKRVPSTGRSSHSALSEEGGATGTTRVTQDIECDMFQKYECILNNKSETFENKVQSLIDVWKSIAELDLKQFDIRYVIQIIDWAKLHALNIVLTGEWRSMKEIYCNALLNNIDKAQSNLRTINDAFSTRCQKLAHVVKKPWEHPVLTHLLHTREAEIGSEEIEFFCVETAYLVSVRLKKLCENHCEDLALNLVTNFIACKKLSDRQNFSLNATETQMWFIFDIYIALLFKFQDRGKILQNFEELKLEEGYQLIKRFAKKRVKISKIWRNCHKVAIFGSRFFLLRTLMKFSESSEYIMKELLENIMKVYIFLSNTEVLLQQFVSTVRTITSVADAAGLCVLCEIIHTEAGTKIRHFAIEMYIRALTTDMNELEKLKHLKEDDKVLFTNSRLARTFTNLADLLKDHVNVARECVLTAFSLEPTKARLQLITELATQCGFPVIDTGQEWKCQLHPPVLPTDEIAWVCSVCGDWMCKPELNAPAMQTNTPLNEALQESVLGISEALCDDLAVCLSNPRYQILSWLLPWTDLYRLCVMYLNNPEKTKNFITELKYVDIDYSLFQHIKKEPLDEYSGIEKGYEQYLDLNFVSDEEEVSSISEDSSQDRALSLGSDGSGEPYPLLQPKSDPKTLKSLRMFRPSIKRKATGSEGDIPEKHFKGDSEQASSPATISDTYSNSPCSLSEILGGQYSSGKVAATGADSPVSNTITSEPSACKNTESLESKNGVVATLPPFGGQVAVNSSSQPTQMRRWEVQETTKEDLIQLLQNRLLCNGTKGNKGKQGSDYNMNSNRDSLLSTKQIFAKMIALHKPKDQQATISQPLVLNTEANSPNMKKPVQSLPYNNIQQIQATMEDLTQIQTTRSMAIHSKSDLEKLNSFAPIINLQPRVVVSDILLAKGKQVTQTSHSTSPLTSPPCSSKLIKPKATTQLTKILKVALIKLPLREGQCLTSQQLKEENSAPISNNQDCLKQDIMKETSRRTLVCNLPALELMEIEDQELTSIPKNPPEKEQPQNNANTVNQNQIELAKAALCQELVVRLTSHVADQAQLNLIQQNFQSEDKETPVMFKDQTIQKEQECSKELADASENTQQQEAIELQMNQEEHLNLANYCSQQSEQPKITPSSQKQQIAQSAQQTCETIKMEQTDYTNQEVPSSLTVICKEAKIVLTELSSQQIELAKIALCSEETTHANPKDQVVVQPVLQPMQQACKENLMEYPETTPTELNQQVKSPKSIMLDITNKATEDTLPVSSMEQTCKADQDKQTQLEIFCQQTGPCNKEPFLESPSNFQEPTDIIQTAQQESNLNEEEHQERSPRNSSNQPTMLLQASLFKEELPAPLQETVTPTTREIFLETSYQNPQEGKLEINQCFSQQMELGMEILDILEPLACSSSQEHRAIETLTKTYLERPQIEQIECHSLQVQVDNISLHKQELLVSLVEETFQEDLEECKVKMELAKCSIQEMETNKEISKEEPSLSTSQEEPTLNSCQGELTLSSSQEEPTLNSSQEESTLNSSQQEPTLNSSQEEPSLNSSQEELILNSSQEKQIETPTLLIQELFLENFQECKAKVEVMQCHSHQMEVNKTTLCKKEQSVSVHPTKQERQTDSPVPPVQEISQVRLEEPKVEQMGWLNRDAHLEKVTLDKQDQLCQPNNRIQEVTRANLEEQTVETECLDPIVKEEQLVSSAEEQLAATSAELKIQEIECLELDKVKVELPAPSSSREKDPMCPVQSLQEVFKTDPEIKVESMECFSQEVELPKVISRIKEVSPIHEEHLPMSQAEVTQSTVKGEEEEEEEEEDKKPIMLDCHQNGSTASPQSLPPESQIRISSLMLENSPNTTIQAGHDTEVNVSTEVNLEDNKHTFEVKVEEKVQTNKGEDIIKHELIEDNKETIEKMDTTCKEITDKEQPLEERVRSSESTHVLDSFEQLFESLNDKQRTMNRYKKSAKESSSKKSSIGYIDDEIFCDLTDYKSEEEFFNISSSDDTFEFYKYMDDLEKHYKIETTPKDLKKYKNTHKIQQWNVPCFKIDYDNELQHNKNTDSTDSVCVTCKKVHLNLVNDYKLKDLRVMLQRIPTKKSVEENNINERRCRRTTKFVVCHCCAAPKKRKSNTKPEKYLKKRRVLSKKASPLLDKNKKEDCLDKYVQSEELKISSDNESSNGKPRFIKKVLKQVPGLYDYDMLAPTNRHQIINVVQVSNSRTASQNTQTSTQISPHIQRIGQPRVVEQKPESSESTAETSTSTEIPTTSTATATKPAPPQPSTLINILSQQIIKPGPHTVRRQAPFINILSQQIIRPSLQSPKIPSTNVALTENSLQSQNNPLKPESTTLEAVSQSQVDTTAKSVPSTTTKIANTVTSNQGGTILQFICKSTLPKFQQAFGKAVFTNSTSESTETTTTTTVETATNTNTTSNVEIKKIIPSKTLPVNVQPIQGNVIYRGQMPVGQTISLIPPGSTTRQLFRITGSTHEQISLVKESVIQNKMSALLAAALQGKPKTTDQNGEVVEEVPAARITLCRPGTQTAARIVKPVQLQIPTNVIRSHTQPNMSSTTLEQLREFDMVYKQIKERSSNSSQGDQASNATQESSEQTSPQQKISFTYVNQTTSAAAGSPTILNVAASAQNSSTSSSSSVTPASTATSSLPKIASKPSKGKSLKSGVSTSPAKTAPTLPKPQQKPQEDEHTTQRIFDILAEYAEQLRNSPDLNNKPAPRRRSNPPNNHSAHSKRKKSSGSKKNTGHTNSTIEIETDDLTMGSEDSSGGNVVQLSVTDDEQSQTTNISSTPPETSSETTTTTTRQQVVLAEGSNTQPSRNVILADSTVGEALKMPSTALIVPGSYIMPVSMVKGAQQIAVVSGGSKILATVPARSGQNMLLFQSFVNQNRKGAISAVKYSAIQPITGISSQSIAGVSAQPPVILPSNSVATAVALGQPIALKKVDDAERGVNTELLLTISQPRDMSVKQEENSPEMAQPDSSTSLSSDSVEVKVEDAADSSSNEKVYTFQKGNAVATSVISSCMKEELEGVKEEVKAEEESSGSGERIQSVLVNASASNGPMLSHTHTRYRKPSDSVEAGNNTAKEEFVHNGEKATTGESKIYKSNTVYYAIKTKRNSSSKKLESDIQKQAAIERELRLQKSLSEECEDLGVDEPSTSDLFPEADLLFDTNHSPSYDQSSQDVVKRTSQATTSTAPVSEIKVEAKTSMNLFSDDDENSGSLRTDLFNYVEYHTVENALNYQSQQIINGNNASNQSASSCEDNVLLPNCSAMSDVTLNSPISPEMYSDNTQPALNKYKYKYTNRKKGERLKTESWPTEVTSSEDTIAPSERDKTLLPQKNPASKSETTCRQIALKEESSHDSFKVVRVAISKNDTIREEDKCQLHCEDSKRGSRRSARKPCSCCNGSKNAGVSTSTAIAKKRPVSQPQAPAPHKKTFFNKKR